MNHFVLDVETLSVESTAIVLSCAIIHFDFEKDATVTYDELVERALYVKFKLKEQHDLGRTTLGSTIEWWMKQGSAIRDLCFKPSPKDVGATEGMIQIENYVQEHGTKSSMIWARGSLDQMALDSLSRTIGRNTIVPYNMWMDIRTAIRLTKETSDQRGYCDIPGFDHSTVDKHNPIADCALDILQLVQGT